MLNENQIRALPERITQRLSDINTEYLESIGKVLKKIDELRPADVHRLPQIYNYGADMERVINKIEQVSGKNVQEIYDVFDIVAKENLNSSRQLREAKGIKLIPYEEHESLKEYVKSLARQTANEYVRLTRHTAFAVLDKGGKNIAPLYAASKDKLATSLSDTYTKLVDYAVRKVQLGGESYQKAVKDICKAMVNSGIKTVDSAAGYIGRLESAVRQSILRGVKQCNQNTAAMIGEEYGADGYEVSYHSNPRPSHREMGGRQYAIGKPRTVDGVYYPSFERTAKPLLEEYGCLHFYYPILLGVSLPAYSKEQLEELKANDNKIIEFEGKEYTGSEAEQIQRKLETAIRHNRDLLISAKASGSKELENEAKEHISLLTRKYKRFSEAAGLPAQMERTRLAVKKVDKSVESGIISYKGLAAKIGDKDIPLHDEPKFLKTIDFNDKSVVSKELIDFEKKAKYRDIETALVITKEGKVYECYGISNRVFPDSDLKEELRGAAVSHNHPIEETIYSFSEDDLQLFLKYELETLRGCDSEYIYEFSRNSREIDDLPDKWQSEEIYHHAIMIVRSQMLSVGYRRRKND